MTYEQHQEQQRRQLDAARQLDRAQLAAAQAARLARRISDQLDASERTPEWTTFGPDHIGTARVASAIEVARITGGAR